MSWLDWFKKPMPMVAPGKPTRVQIVLQHGTYPWVVIYPDRTVRGTEPTFDASWQAVEHEVYGSAPVASSLAGRLSGSASAAARANVQGVLRGALHAEAGPP